MEEREIKKTIIGFLKKVGMEEIKATECEYCRKLVSDGFIRLVTNNGQCYYVFNKVLIWDHTITFYQGEGNRLGEILLGYVTDVDYQTINGERMDVINLSLKPEKRLTGNIFKEITNYMKE